MNTSPKTALYIRALDIIKFEDNLQLFVDTFQELEAAVGFDKVYLETHRDLVIPDDNTLLSLKAYLEQMGIEVSGGITVTVDEMDDFRTYCYSNSEHRKKIKSFVEKTAGLFDEILFVLLDLVLKNGHFLSVVLPIEVNHLHHHFQVHYRPLLSLK